MTEAKMSIEELRANKIKRELARDKEFEAFEFEALQLEEKYETAGQRLGIDFSIVTTAIGNFAVRKPDFVIAKKFADNDKKGTEDIVNFVDPCVLFPERMQARAMFQEHAGIAWKLSGVVLKLYEADTGKRQGK